MLTRRVGGSGVSIHAADLMSERARVAHRVAAAAHAELAADRRQREHRGRRAAAVAVALEAPAAADQRRRRLDVELGEAARASPASMPASAAARSIVHGAARRAQALGAVRVLGEERLVGVAFLEQHAVERQRERQIGARAAARGADRPACASDVRRGSMTTSARRRLPAPPSRTARGGCPTPTG